MSRSKNVLSSLRYFIPLIPIFFGFFVWLEGANIFIDQEHTYIYSFALCCFWFFTLCFLFINFKRIKLQSKILVLLIALSLSLEFYVLIWYNSIGSDVCLLYIFSSKDIFIILFSSIISILGIMAIVFGILIPQFKRELNYLTNILGIKNRESSRRYRFLEILSSFPVFIGIHYIFFLLFGINNAFSCNTLPLNYVIIIATPWIILMIFYIIYCSIVIRFKS